MLPSGVGISRLLVLGGGQCLVPMGLELPGILRT